jgi:serine/threonine-protein kinase
MSTEQHLNPSSSGDRLAVAVASYLEAKEKGQTPDPEEFVTRYPDIARQLREFLEGYERFGGALAPIREKAPGTGTAIGMTFGDYEVLQEIARGGMGIVYRARQKSLDRIVALKMIRDRELADTDDVRRFRTEAESAAGLDHPNIVPIYEVGEHDGQHFFSMKFIEGGSLAKLPPRLASDQRLLAQLLIKVARAVHHAHQRGILHRDLKPANILLDSGGEPHVTDFGLAKRVEGGAGLTQTGAIVGTLCYMAPEQAAAEKVLTTAVDVYGLGAVFYELLTGRPPFRGANDLDTLLQVRAEEPVRPRAINPKVDRDLETICLKCLAKEPHGRYGSAEMLAEELERWLAGKPILGRPVGSVERAVKWVKRRPAIAGLLAAVLLVAAAGFAGTYWQYLDALEEADLKEIERRNAVAQTGVATAKTEEAKKALRGPRTPWSRKSRPSKRQKNKRNGPCTNCTGCAAEG